MTAMMDSNGNGRLDSDELDRMPSFVREMLRSRGVELQPGIRLDDVRSSMERGKGQGEDGQLSDRDGRGDRSKPLTPYKMKPKEPLVLELPPAYSEVDLDLDGQLGLYEWMQTRRAEIERFDAMDLDSDGYLTPDELLTAETAATTESAVASTERKKLTIVGAPQRESRGERNASGNGNEGGRDQRRGFGGDSSQMASMYFGRLDKDGDGTISTDEWQDSQRVRGMFERAGIPIAEMSMEQFASNLERVSQDGGGR